ncbi:MAG: M14 family metallopeptidase, partial [candidate division WOR-3 bacterium]
MKGIKKMVVILITAGFLFSSEKIIRIYLPTWNDVIQSLTPVFGKKLPEVVAGRPNEWYDFIVYDEDIAKIRTLNIPFEIIVDDLEKMKELVRGQYHSYDQIKQILHQMQSSYPSLAKVESIGPSYQGRWIYGVKVSDNVNIDEDETELVFSGCHHAREWASIETALFIADTLLRGYGSDPTITQIVNTREIWVFPIINVDGYAYDYPNQLNWRKNRQPFHNAIGTDLNRNYNGTCETDARGGWGWIPAGGSVTHYPSSEVFCGFKGFSAPETKAYSDFLKQRHAVGIIDFHSYSELVLGAWGHVSDPTP